MKKIFLWGDFDALMLGGIKFYKEKDDFLLVTLNCSKNYRSMPQLMLDSVKYIKNEDNIPAYRSMFKYFKQEKPDFLAVVSGHLSVDSVVEFNKTKYFCEEHNAELVVIKTTQLSGLTVISPTEIYDKISNIITKELV